MFDIVRKHTKLFMVLLFLLVIPSFVLLGIDGYTRMDGAGQKVATVDGKNITQTEWDAAHRLEIDRIRAQNPNIDLTLLDAPELKYATLEQLVRERVLATAAADSHLGVSDAALASALQQDSTIAALRKPDGTLDIEQYRRLLATQGLTPESFEARVRADLARQQVLAAVYSTALASPAQADVAMNAFLEQREIRVVRFSPAEFAAKVQPTDADLEAFYQQNQARYQVPETADIEYLVLDLDAVKKGVTVSEEDLRKYYEQNQATLGTPEERRAAHILIAAPKDAPAAEREKAKAQATALLEQLRKAPDTFAEVARKSSADDVSAPSGGDLGFFQRNSKGADPVIAATTYALAKAGDISDVVETEFGYHLVKLTEIKPSNVPPFEKLRSQLEDQVRTAEARQRFGELAEEFRNGVYEQADSLKPVADKLKLTVQTAAGVTRTPATDASGPLANAKFLSALFRSDAIEKKHNTEAMETSANELVSGRVVRHVAAHARPLAEVKEQVRAAFVEQRSADLAREQGQAQLKSWTEQPKSVPADLPAPVVVSRGETHGQPAAVLEAVLRADPAKLPVFVGVNLGTEGFAVVRVDKIVPRPAPTAEEAQQNLQRYEQLWANAEAHSYYEQLKERYKAKILVPQPASTLTLPATPR